MNFDKKLRDALRVIPLTDVDKRLDMPSELTVVTSNTEHVPGLDDVMSLEPGSPNTNFARQKVYLREAFDQDVDDEVESELEGEEEDIGLDPTEEEDSLPEEEITDADLPEPEDQEAPGPPGLPSGSKYTLQQAKGQLDGVIKQWMDLAGNYPEGDKRHNFLEIGERLREITAVIQRDYMQEGI